MLCQWLFLEYIQGLLHRSLQKTSNGFSAKSPRFFFQWYFKRYFFPYSACSESCWQILKGSSETGTNTKSYFHSFFRNISSKNQRRHASGTPSEIPPELLMISPPSTPDFFSNGISRDTKYTFIQVSLSFGDFFSEFDLYFGVLSGLLPKKPEFYSHYKKNGILREFKS